MKSAYTDNNSSGDSEQNDNLSSSSSSSSNEESDDNEENQISITLRAPGVCADHAFILNTSGRCVLSCATQEASDLTWINGASVSRLRQTQHDSVDEGSGGIMLEHADRVAFGCAIFMFVEPAKGIPEMMIMSGQVTYAKARKELPRDWRNICEGRRPQPVHLFSPDVASEPPASPPLSPVAWDGWGSWDALMPHVVRDRFRLGGELTSQGVVAEMKGDVAHTLDVNVTLAGIQAGFEAKHAELRSVNAEIEAKYAELEAKNAELEAQNDELMSKYAELDAKHAMAMERNAELEAKALENCEFVAKHTKLAARSSELEAKVPKIAELEAKHAKLARRNAELEAKALKNAELEGKHVKLIARNAELDAKAAELETLAKANKVKDLKIEQLQQSLRELERVRAANESGTSAKRDGPRDPPSETRRSSRHELVGLAEAITGSFGDAIAALDAAAGCLESRPVNPGPKGVIRQKTIQ